MPTDTPLLVGLAAYNAQSSCPMDKMSAVVPYCQDQSTSRSSEARQPCSECGGTGQRIEPIYAVSDFIWGGGMPCMVCKGDGFVREDSGGDCSAPDGAQYPIPQRDPVP